MPKEPANKKITLDNLAQMIQRGFSDVDDNFSKVHHALGELSADHTHLEEKVDAISGVLVNVPTKDDLNVKEELARVTNPSRKTAHRDIINNR